MYDIKKKTVPFVTAAAASIFFVVGLEMLWIAFFCHNSMRFFFLDKYYYYVQFT